MASSNIRYGAGVSREIGMVTRHHHCFILIGSTVSRWTDSLMFNVLLQDLKNLGAQNVCLMTDRNLSVLPPFKAVLESLGKNGVQYKVYDNVRVEPTDTR